MHPLGSKSKLSEITLADGRPVHHALVSERAPEHVARLNVATLHRIHPEAVEKCQGKTAFEALQILLGIGREDVDYYPV